MQLCAFEEDFLHENVLHLASDGRLEVVKVISLQEDRMDEARRIVEKLVTHRCNLPWRSDTTQQFLHELQGNLHYHQLQLAIYVSQHLVSLLRTMGSFHEDFLAVALHNLGDNLSNIGQLAPAMAATEEALKLRQTLFAQEPDTHRVNLAQTLHNLGLDRSDSNRWEGAVEVMSVRIQSSQS